MVSPAELGKLKDQVKTNIERAREGGCPDSVLLLMRSNSLPMAQITDSRGLITTKVMSLMDLLSALDASVTLTQLQRQGIRHTELPALPKNTLLTSVTERPDRVEFVLTGYVEPQPHLFVLEGNAGDKTYEIQLPHIVYRAVYNEDNQAVTSLSMALCIPGDGEPTAESTLLRWPFSNVYDQFGDLVAGVCWPGVSQIQTPLRDVPEQVVKGFVTTPNNRDMYGRGRSNNAPYHGYGALLEAIEREDGIREDYLTPLGLTVAELHRQQRT